MGEEDPDWLKKCRPRYPWAAGALDSGHANFGLSEAERKRHNARQMFEKETW